jgi:tetratricopeptide (TPR) repeat protein
VNIALKVFNFRRLLALFSAPRTPLDAALRDLAHGEAERALEALDELLRCEDSADRRAEIVNKRGVALVALERRDEAREAFRSALEIVPHFAPALVNLGNLELERGELESAIGFYHQALERDSQNASAYRHLALVYRKMGRGADALKAFSRARRLEGRANVRQRK